MTSQPAVIEINLTTGLCTYDKMGGLLHSFTASQSEQVTFPQEGEAAVSFTPLIDPDPIQGVTADRACSDYDGTQLPFRTLLQPRT
jgi:hypothetical protein